MNFIKKNWSKLTIAILSAVLAVTMFELLVTMDYTFMLFCQFFGILVFFIGLTSYLVLKFFSKTKTYAKYVLLGTGMISLIFLSIYFIDAINTYKDWTQVSRWSANCQLYMAAVNVFVFGLVPFIRGAQKILVFFAKKEDEEKAKLEAERLAAEEQARLEAEAASTKKRKPRTTKAKPAQDTE